MASSKYQEIWNLLKTYNFDIDINLHNDLVCGICKNLLKNACQSPCGCRYCYLCIDSYLNGEEKCCPRNLDECKDQIIDINVDLQYDHVANKKVSLIKVKCPEKLCQFQDELRNFVEHFESHRVKCPYYDMGCNKPTKDIDTMIDHLRSESYDHTILLMDFIGNLRNEVSSLKDSVIEKEAMADEVRAVRDEVDTVSRDSVQNAMENLRLKEKIVKLEKEKVNLRKTNKRQQELIDEMEEKLSGRDKHECSTRELVADIEANETSSECRNPSPCGSFSNLAPDNFGSPPPRNLEEQVCAPFDWRIDNFLEKRHAAKTGCTTKVYSQPFYLFKNGYKMRLQLNPNGYGSGENTHFSVLFAFLKGEYDDTLLWPMKRTIIIALIDQRSQTPHVKDSYRYRFVSPGDKIVFMRPSSRENEYFGTPQFMNVNVMLNNSRICKNGTIVLRCSVD